MDYNNNNNNNSYNNNYNNSYNSYDNNSSYDSGSFSQNNQNPYEQSYANNNQNYNQSAYSYSSYGNNYQTTYDPVGSSANEEPVSMLDWIGTLLILLIPIPCVSLIIYLIWAFGSNTKKSKANFCRAYLILMLIISVLTVLFSGVILSFLAAFAEMLY